MFVYWVPFSSVPGVACCDFARKADGYNLPKIIGPWSSIRTFALMSGRNFATIPAYTHTHTHGRTWCAEIWMKASGNDVPVKFDAVFCSQLTWRNIPLGQQKFKKGTTNPRSPIPIRFPSVMFWPTAWFLMCFNLHLLVMSPFGSFWFPRQPADDRSATLARSSIQQKGMW